MSIDMTERTMTRGIRRHHAKRKGGKYERGVIGEVWKSCLRAEREARLNWELRDTLKDWGVER